MLFREGERRPWVVAGSMGGDIQPQIHVQLVSALVDGGADIATAVAAPRVVVEPAGLARAAASRVLTDGELAPGVADGPRASAATTSARVAYDGGLGHEHAIELVDGGPAARRDAGGRDRPPELRAAGGPLSRPGGRASPDRPAAGRERGRRMVSSGSRWQAALTPICRRHRLTAEARVTSNVGQNYPYTSETEADRAPARRLARRGARGPGRQAQGRDHAARHQRALVGLEVPHRRAARASCTPRATRIEKHAVFVVCDGTCAKTFLR